VVPPLVIHPNMVDVRHFKLVNRRSAKPLVDNNPTKNIVVLKKLRKDVLSPTRISRGTRGACAPVPNETVILNLKQLVLLFVDEPHPDP
jgi:hypothetical protein